MLEQQQYEIQQILAAHFYKPQNRHYYLVKWSNWPIEDCTWQPQDHLTNAPQAVQQFIQKQKRNQVSTEWNKYNKFTQFWKIKKTSNHQTPNKYPKHKKIHKTNKNIQKLPKTSQKGLKTEQPTRIKSQQNDKQKGAKLNQQDNIIQIFSTNSQIKLQSKLQSNNNYQLSSNHNNNGVVNQLRLDQYSESCKAVQEEQYVSTPKSVPVDYKNSRMKIKQQCRIQGSNKSRKSMKAQYSYKFKQSKSKEIKKNKDSQTKQRDVVKNKEKDKIKSAYKIKSNNDDYQNKEKQEDRDQQKISNEKQYQNPKNSTLPLPDPNKTPIKNPPLKSPYPQNHLLLQQQNQLQYESDVQPSPTSKPKFPQLQLQNQPKLTNSSNPNKITQTHLNPPPIRNTHRYIPSGMNINKRNKNTKSISDSSIINNQDHDPCEYSLNSSYFHLQQEQPIENRYNTGTRIVRYDYNPGQYKYGSNFHNIVANSKTNANTNLKDYLVDEQECKQPVSVSQLDQHQQYEQQQQQQQEHEQQSQHVSMNLSASVQQQPQYCYNYDFDSSYQQQYEHSANNNDDSHSNSNSRQQQQQAQQQSVYVYPSNQNDKQNSNNGITGSRNIISDKHKMKRELELYKQKIGSTGNTGNTGNMGITSNIDNTNISTSTKQPDIPTSKLTCLKLIQDIKNRINTTDMTNKINSTNTNTNYSRNRTFNYTNIVNTASTGRHSQQQRQANKIIQVLDVQVQGQDNGNGSSNQKLSDMQVDCHDYKQQCVNLQQNNSNTNANANTNSITITNSNANNNNNMVNTNNPNTHPQQQHPYKQQPAPSPSLSPQLTKKQQIKVIGVRRLPHSDNLFKYQVQTLTTRHRYWLTKQQIYINYPIELIQFYQHNIVLRNQMFVHASATGKGNANRKQQ